MGKVRQKIESLFDYRGDIAKNADGAAPRTYSMDYSPNNIRRVVVSPNGVLIVYHRAVAGTQNRSFGVTEFQDRDLYVEEQAKNYKPILRLLADPLVCSTVEEIVVLSNSLSGQVHPNYLSETRLEAMVSSFKGAGSDLKTRISNRFGRLRYYSVININFKEFYNYFRSAVQSREISKYYFFSDMPVLKARAQVTELAGEDYWKSYDVRPAIYAFDAKLKEYFDGIKQRREAELKAQAVDAAREQRVGGRVKALNDMIDDYLIYHKLWSTYYNIIQREGTNGVLPDLRFIGVPDKVEIYKFKGMRNVPEAYLSKQQRTESEAFSLNEEKLKGYKARCASALVTDFLKALELVGSQGESILLNVILQNCETGISVPPTCQAMAQRLEATTGFKFTGRDIKSTVVSCCSNFLRYFVDCEHTESFSKDYWESKLEGRSKA